jgi:ketosteroid isomerase-like protein
MAIPTEKEIKLFLTRQLEYWNARQREEMTALYRKYAQDQLVIEYVGQPIGDGWETYNHMWDTYNGKVRTDVVQVLVNGNEGACHFNNVRVATGSGNPSIEIYRFDDRRLHIRYFHETHAV